MKGLLTWASDKLKQRYPLTTMVIGKTIELVDYVFSFLRSSEKVKQAKLEFQDGLFNPSTKEVREFLQKAEETRSHLYRATKITLSAVVLRSVYALLIKNILRNYINIHWGVEWVIDRTVEAGIYKASCYLMNRLEPRDPKISTIKHVANEFADAYRCTSTLPLSPFPTPESVGLIVYNFSSVTCLNTVSKREVNAKYGILYNPCNCQIIQTPIFAYVHYGMEKIGVLFVRYVLPGGEILSIPLEALSEGKFGMIAKLDGKCSPDQRDVLDRNNWYSMGKGHRFVLPTRFLSWTLPFIIHNKTLCGIMESGLTAFLSQLFIVSNNIRHTPYPGKAKETFNPFQLLHVCGEAALKFSLENSSGITNLYNKFVNSNIRFNKIEEADVKALEANPVIQIMNNLLLPKDLQLVRTFLCSEAMRKYLAQHRMWLASTLQSCLDLVNKFPFPIQDHIPSTLTWVYNNKKTVLHKEELIMLYGAYFLFDRDKQRLLKALSIVLNYVRSVQADDRNLNSEAISHNEPKSKFQERMEQLRREHPVPAAARLTRASTQPITQSESGMFAIHQLKRQLSSNVSTSRPSNLKTA